MRGQIREIRADVRHETRSRAPGSERLMQVRERDTGALHHSLGLEAHDDPLARSSDAGRVAESETGERPIERRERVVIHELEPFELCTCSVETDGAIGEFAAPDEHERKRPRY